MKRIVISLITLLLLLTGCSKEEFKPNVKQIKDTLELGEQFDVNKALLDVNNEGLTFKVVSGTIDSNTPGKYEITYAISKKRQSMEKTFTFYVKDKDAPVITCDDTIEVLYGSSFVLKNYVKAEDAVDGDVTDNIRFTGAIDLWTVGKYTITLYAADRYGNSSSKTITVLVIKDSEESYKTFLCGTYKDITSTAATVPTLTLREDNTFNIILSTEVATNNYSGTYLQYEDMIYLYSEHFQFASRTEENLIKLVVELDGTLRFDTFFSVLTTPCMGDIFVKDTENN